MRHGLGEISEKRNRVTRTAADTVGDKYLCRRQTAGMRWSACDVGIGSMYAHLLGISTLSRRSESAKVGSWGQILDGVARVVRAESFPPVTSSRATQER
jgi:hypothetical protein